MIVQQRIRKVVADDTGRIAMYEECTEGSDGSDAVLTRYIYSNHLGSASLELDGSGEIISYEEYHPYGTTAYQAESTVINAVAKRYRYTGKERDEETGLYYHGARYYIPWLCRWSSVDPKQGEMPVWSPYNYGFCNPVTWADSTGMMPDDPNWHPPMQKMGPAELTFSNGIPETQYSGGALEEVEVTAQRPDVNFLVPGDGQEATAASEDIAPVVEDNKKSITPADYNRIAERLGIDPIVVQAIAEVESSGGGFNKDGSVKIRFEGHQFKKYLTKQGIDVNELIKEGYGDVIYGYSERLNKPHGYTGYNKATGLNEKGAIYATSFGAFQIMGFNYAAAGHKSLEGFKEAQSTFTGQVESFINFVSQNKGLLQAMKDKDFTTFARLYNGPDYQVNKYDTKMAAKYKNIKDDNMGVKARIAVLIVLYLNGFQSTAQVRTIQSGYYENAMPLYLSFDSTCYLITGYIEIRSDNPHDRFVCQLYFRGKGIKGDKIPVLFYQYSIDTTRSHAGWMFVKSANEVIIKSDELLMPCSNLIDIFTGEEVEFKEKRPYVKIAILRVGKQNLFEAPNKESQLKSYVIQNDPLGVVKEEGEWLLIRYLKNEKIEAWIPKASIW